MTPTEKLSATIAANEPHLGDYAKRVQEIGSRIPGWSRHHHYLFFKSWMDAFPEARSVLICGVYLGRDIAFMLDAAGERELRITGVDKFNAEPCDDWPPEKRGMTWQEAFRCEPPDSDQARANFSPFAKDGHRVQLVKADDKEWLESATGAYDLIFLDTSHDKATVQRQIRAVHKLCHPETIVAGDDYAPLEKTWGVSEAVKEGFRSHQVLADTIWFTDAKEFL